MRIEQISSLILTHISTLSEKLDIFAKQELSPTFGTRDFLQNARIFQIVK